jgi:hypothetical protein
MSPAVGRSTLLAACAAAGCVTYFALDPYLNKAVGQKLGAERYPELSYSRLITETETTRTVEYAIDPLWRCRWLFVVERSTGTVTSWSYPDANAKQWCSSLPTSRP